jgi:hypothetical protein
MPQLTNGKRLKPRKIPFHHAIPQTLTTTKVSSKIANLLVTNTFPTARRTTRQAYTTTKRPVLTALPKGTGTIRRANILALLHTPILGKKSTGENIGNLTLPIPPNLGVREIPDFHEAKS